MDAQTKDRQLDTLASAASRLATVIKQEVERRNDQKTRDKRHAEYKATIHELRRELVYAELELAQLEVRAFEREERRRQLLKKLEQLALRRQAALEQIMSAAISGEKPAIIEPAKSYVTAWQETDEAQSELSKLDNRYDFDKSCRVARDRMAVARAKYSQCQSEYASFSYSPGPSGPREATPKVTQRDIVTAAFALCDAPEPAVVAQDLLSLESLMQLPAVQQQLL